MEAAARKVDLLSQQILPENPHCLSLFTNHRYRVYPEKDHYFEEKAVQQLQYSTLLWEGDRGILFTRPYYDMREEPPNAAATNAQTKMDKKNVTKLSLSDYKNKQKKSTSPPDSSQVTVKVENERRPRSPPRPKELNAKLDPDRTANSEPKRAEEVRKPNDMKQRDALGITVEKPHRHRDTPDDER
jgi:hypothetical protein